jgi:hypothetical protein
MIYNSSAGWAVAEKSKSEMNRTGSGPAWERVAQARRVIELRNHDM